MLTSKNFSSSQYLLLYLWYLKVEKKTRRKSREFLILIRSMEIQNLTLSQITLLPAVSQIIDSLDVTSVKCSDMGSK
jgi:hypothetical protein